MADDRMYLGHKGTGLAIYLAKMLANDWTMPEDWVAKRWNTFMAFLLNLSDPVQRDAFWESYQSTTDDFVLLRENSFNHSWTTPSGRLDYDVDEDKGILRISFDPELIRQHRSEEA